jgi:endonuclease/exonuclease/phosphatase family metal-dependent hydrolase
VKNLLLALPFAFFLCYCQKPQSFVFPDPYNEHVCRIMFWNAENLFDCQKDSINQDDEFSPYGVRAWNPSRYKKKISNMYKVFIAAGDWEPPDMIGLCEIENRNVLFALIRDTPFSYYDYRFIHHDSPDRRGIDVALLYNPVKVQIISERAIPVQLTVDTSSQSRDILLVRVKILTGDTLSVFVNHWPSKYGGAGITEDLREAVAKILAQNILEIIKVNPLEKIIVMGDFNDPPESSSITILLDATIQPGKGSLPILINLAKETKGPIPGSYKFDGAWQMIDQVLVSQSLMSGDGEAIVKPESFRVFSPDFLLERDEKFGGMKPNRTYTGFVYHGGYSDHLPVILDLFPAK